MFLLFHPDVIGSDDKVTGWHAGCYFIGEPELKEPNAIPPQEAVAKNDVENRILAYLERHPEAQDTLHGIIQWWLMEQEVRFQSDLVEEALRNLVKRDVIVEVVTTGSYLRYKVNNKN